MRSTHGFAKAGSRHRCTGYGISLDVSASRCGIASIAALADVVVVGGGHGGGPRRIAARYAAEVYGRDVAALPGSRRNPAAAGACSARSATAPGAARPRRPPHRPGSRRHQPGNGARRHCSADRRRRGRAAACARRRPGDHRRPLRTQDQETRSGEARSRTGAAQAGQTDPANPEINGGLSLNAKGPPLARIRERVFLPGCSGNGRDLRGGADPVPLRQHADRRRGFSQAGSMLLTCSSFAPQHGSGTQRGSACLRAPDHRGDPAHAPAVRNRLRS